MVGKGGWPRCPSQILILLIESLPNSGAATFPTCKFAYAHLLLVRALLASCAKSPAIRHPSDFSQFLPRTVLTYAGKQLC